METGKLTPEQVAALRAIPVPSSGNRVGIALAIAEVSQMEVSRRTGLHQQNISELKRGVLSPNVSINTARKLSQYFGCEIDDLFPPQESAQGRVA